MKNVRYIFIGLLFLLMKPAHSQETLASAAGAIALPPPPPVINIFVSGKIYLQGAFNTQTGIMNNALNTQGLLQAYALSQPYNTPEFGNYSGNEQVSKDFFPQHPEIVDWVLITVRSPDVPTMTLKRAAFVRQDGVLVEIDGVSTAIAFNEIAGGNYYVTVQHRNHLGIRTTSLVDFSTGAASYDYTSASDKTYKTQIYSSTVQIGTVWAMRGGNANGDNNVKYNGPANDQDKLQNIDLGGSSATVLSNRYSPSDLNMDGVIKTNGPANDQNFLLNTVLGGLLGSVYQQQL